MDVVLMLWALEGQPLRIDGKTAWFAGAMAPITLPVTALPADRRAATILAETRLPIGERVALALAWGDVRGALRAAGQVSAPLLSDPDLFRALSAWATDECVRLGIPPVGELVAIDQEGKPRPLTSDERGAFTDVRELLAPLSWPRWCGPLVLVPYGLDHSIIPAGHARIVRPALPVLRPPGGGNPRAELATAMADLVLALSVPPAHGWPAWLTSGVAGCVRARATFVGIPEHAMAVRRAAAGAKAIRVLLGNAQPVDADLATAVCAAFLYPARRARFPDLLELLRHDASGLGAVLTAYQLTPELLAAPP
ncbi:MAG: hypothetical protein AAB263_02875 [Planctomycetota bacterium]